ncbi:MAG: sigma-54-dependent Fis family transcriptional regulator [Ignavibacteria bacterium]|jgi:two-component system response regulator PilR (NtrC family)|nr:sigma-54-dependent Fis family transcriptional regulator [Ignavibacteria bacterium]MCU7498269.1 sigma-54-dependent Fis family transcriptional regulator [Ignavibacteria bacterium]MCU7511239.1 sigma-54-dependent Fis family transcriptional regulator [Ignavibacteria bacterium]MCU7519039.1 sigma-54-dependent Fis family transcriptional regulator [Ignavibacteria bacterium]MCU7523320.1 sigma-54-dependent Fis family transcriptional regulator [Ignavibacteria bacterium]
MCAKVLIVDDEKVIRESLEMLLRDEGYKAETAADGEEALQKISNDDYDVVLTDIKMPKVDGIELMQKAARISPETFFIIMTAYASVKTAIEALREGAYDYFIKPVEFDDVILRLKRLISYKKLSTENKSLRQRLSSEVGFQNIIGKSEPMQRVFDLISRVSQTNSNVLIVGKSGTGKELVAKAIHFNGHRKDQIFLPVNCGAISENLIESELFGHKKGAFTGATEDKMGLFKVADGGTLFLDEIGDLPLNMQVKLLRVLEDKQFIPVGATRPVTTDVRIIAATNQNLFEKTKTGEFREDLYYRLNVVEIKLPSLNERREDIPVLVSHFIEKFRVEMGRKIVGVDNETMRLLMNHDWRGGVRELENVIERAIIFARDEVITINDLSDYLKGNTFSDNFPDALKDALKIFEREHIIKTIKKYNYDKEEAAKALMIGLSSLYRKMEELDIPTKAPKEVEE